MLLSLIENPWYKAPIEWYFIPVLGVVGAFILPAKFGRHYCGQYCQPVLLRMELILSIEREKFLRAIHLRKVFLLLFVGIFLMTFSPWKMGLPESMTQTYWAAAFSKFWILWIICPFGVAFPLIFLLGFWKGGRTWCNYVCPWGAIGVALGKPQLKVTTKCTDCKACTNVCPQPEVLEGAIGPKGGTIDKNCLTCLKCVDVCSPKAIEWLKP